MSGRLVGAVAAAAAMRVGARTSSASLCLLSCRLHKSEPIVCPAVLGTARYLATTPVVREPEKKDVSKADEPKKPFLTRTWHTIKHEVAHYWQGTKLLGKEISISTRLLRRMIMGYHLTRREHRQLRRTMGDLLRLIPFIPFVLIPMAELLLPVALRLFPNMLPSTFESKFAQEEKRRRLLKLRIEMAKFLKDSIKQGGLQVQKDVQESDAFKEFFRKIRNTDENPTPDDVVRVAKLFDDDVTLDNLTRPQLVSVSRYMQLSAFGTDNYLRFQIRHALNRIRQDDYAILREDTQSMSTAELQAACQSRGIWTHKLDKEQLRESLDEWLHLHIREKISGTLLILSRAFYFVGHLDTANQSYHYMQIKGLEMTMSSLPDSLLNETELHYSKEAATNKQRLEVLQEQEELIEDEAEQEEDHKAAREEERQRKDAERQRESAEAALASRIVPRPAGPKPDLDDARMTPEQLHELGEALSILSAKSSVLRERQELAEMMQSLPQEEHETGEESGQIKSLYRRIRSMLERIDKQLEEFDHDVGGRMNLIEASSTGKISVDDLEQALRMIKHRPDEDSLQKIVDKLDVDLDGLVPLDDVLELAGKHSVGGDKTHVHDIQRESQQLLSERKKEIVKDDV